MLIRRLIFAFLFICSAFSVSSQHHLDLSLELVEDEHFVPCLMVKLKNISNEPILLSNSSVKEIKKIGRMIVGDNTVFCFKNVSKNGNLFYGGSFIVDRERENIPISPGEAITYKARLAGAGMPFDGAISFHNKQAKDYTKISCYLENIVYTTSDGKTCPRYTLESNSIDIIDLKMFDDDFMNISLKQNGEIYNYMLLFNGRLIPKKAEDLEKLYNKILKKRGFPAVQIQEKPALSSMVYTAGSVQIPEGLFNRRLGTDDLVDIYLYCLMGCKYKSANRPYQMNTSGEVHTVNNKYPKTYINHLISALQEVLSCDGTFYKLTQEKRQHISGNISHWKNQLEQNNFY